MIQPEIYYQILEIEPGASPAEIREAYLDLAIVWHPDRFSDNPRLQKKAEEKIKRINAAYAFLKTYHPQINNTLISLQRTQSDENTQSNDNLDCERLKQFLSLGNLKEADQETKRLLLKLANREKEGWLRLEDVAALSAHALAAIDHWWVHYSQGRFGFSVQRQLWHQLTFKTPANLSVQTTNENKFGQSVRWYVNSLWLSPWDAFPYDSQLPEGSLPREYIFTLQGWWSYSRGLTGYLIWRFDEIFLKL